jgi:hypothetical protein
MQRFSQVAFFVFAWRHDLFLCALRRPRCPDLRQEVHSEFIRQDHDCMRWHVVVMKPNAS